MKVKEITKYVFKGKEYKSLKEIKEEIHNTIGLEVLDKVARVCPLERHRDYEKLLNLLCSKEVRDVLIECLSVEFDEGDDCQDNVITTNILDIKQ